MKKWQTSHLSPHIWTASGQDLANYQVQIVKNYLMVRRSDLRDFHYFPGWKILILLEPMKVENVIWQKSISCKRLSKQQQIYCFEQCWNKYFILNKSTYSGNEKWLSFKYLVSHFSCSDMIKFTEVNIQSGALLGTSQTLTL